MIRWSISAAHEDGEPDGWLLEWDGPGDLEGKTGDTLLLSDEEVQGLAAAIGARG